MKDLIVSVADSYQEKVLEALLPRVPLASGTSTFTFDIIRNIGNDSGSYNDSEELLRPCISSYRHCIVIFDYEGCGAENKKNRMEIEIEVEVKLSKNGWQNRNSVIVINPELENWIWINSPKMREAIGWELKTDIYEWAKQNILFDLENPTKPIRPKESLELILRACNTPKSSSIYKKIASTVSYKKCTDPAFNKLINQLLAWFPLK